MISFNHLFFTLIFIASLTGSFPTSAAMKDCDRSLSVGLNSTVLEQLENLPPLQVNYTRYGQSINRVIKSVRSLRSDRKLIAGLRRALESGEVSPESAQVSALKLRKSLENGALKVLNRDHPTTSDREVLEAYKLMLRQVSGIERDLWRFQNPQSEQASPQITQEDLPDNTRSQIPEEKKATSSLFDRQYKSHKPKPTPEQIKTIVDRLAKNSKSEREAKRTADRTIEWKTADQEDSLAAESKKPQGEPVPSDNQQEPQSVAAANNPHDTKGAQADDGEHSYRNQQTAQAGHNSDQGEASQGEPVPSDNQQEPQAGAIVNNPQDTKATPADDGEHSHGKQLSAQAGHKSDQGEASQGEPVPSDSQQAPQAGAAASNPQDSNGTQGQEGVSAEVQQNSANKNSEKVSDVDVGGNQDEPGSDGLVEGSSSGGQQISQSMEKFFQNLLSKVMKDVADPEKEPNLRGGQDLSSQPAERGHELDELDSKFDFPIPKPTRPTESWSEKSSEKTTASKAPQESLRKATSEEQARVVQALTETTFLRILESYQHHEKLMIALGQFKTTLQTHFTEVDRYDFLRQLGIEVGELSDNLDLSQIHYKNLEDLGLSLLSVLDGGPTHLQRKLKFLDTLLSARKMKASLTQEEESLLKLVRQFLRAFEDDSNPSDQQLGEAFLAQMAGPLSHRVLMSTYATESDMDWALFARDIRASRLNDLLIYSRLNPYMNMLLNSSLAPKNQIAHDGPRVTISENSPELEIAQELDRIQFFYRDGAPPKLEFLKLISGDQLENVFFDDRIDSDPRTLHPKKVTIVLYDISGSMGTSYKYLVRNALIAAYLDRSQREVAAELAEHVVYTMAFDGEPHAHERMASLQQAFNHFEKLRQTPLTYGGDDSITNAVVRTFELIAEHEKTTGALNHANILLITDAVAPVAFDEIETARKSIGPDVDLRFNAISMGDLNKDVRKLVEMQGGEGAGKLGVVSHQHIDYETIDKLLNENMHLRNVQIAAKSFKHELDEKFTNTQVLSIKKQLVMVQEDFAMREAGNLFNHRELMEHLRAEGPDAPDLTLEEFWAIFKRYCLSTISGGWSKDQKLVAITEFFQMLGRELRMDSSDLLSRLPTSERQRLLAWVEQ